MCILPLLPMTLGNVGQDSVVHVGIPSMGANRPFPSPGASYTITSLRPDTAVWKLTRLPITAMSGVIDTVFCTCAVSRMALYDMTVTQNRNSRLSLFGITKVEVLTRLVAFGIGILLFFMSLNPRSLRDWPFGENYVC